MRVPRHVTRFGLTALLAAVGFAQQTVGPSPEITGGPKGDKAGPYSITNSWEAGYRYHTVGGNEGKYRSDVNFGNGVRLLASQLTVHSQDGKARLFDELVVNTQGLGDDPYQFANLRLRKNRGYEYNLLWRSNAYFNPALTIANGQHQLDTVNRWQDHELVLRPESMFKGLLGYSRNSREGAGLSTVNFFGALGDEFPLFSDLRWKRNEYRLGGEIDRRRFRLRVTRVWENFKDDPRQGAGEPLAGYDRDDLATLEGFRRDGPYHGNSTGWRGFLFAETGRWLSVSVRGTYTGSERDFVVDESAAGINPFGGSFDRQIVTFGTGRRPVVTGSGTISLFPSERLVIANHTAFHQLRTEGDSLYREFNNRNFDFSELAFQSLGIRTVVNTSDISYRWRPWLGLYGGYHYSTRRVRSRELLSGDGLDTVVAAGQTNTLHSGLMGVRLQPVKLLTLNLEGEIGRAGRPFFPVGERNYHLVGGRIQYKTPRLLLAAATRIHYNANAVTLSAHSSRSRSHAFDFSWVPSERFAVDAGYNRMRLETRSGIAYFAAFELVEGDRSIYASNISAAHAGIRAVLTKRLSMYAGYHRVQDTGDGRERAAVPPGGADHGSALALFREVQTFPLAFESPLARLTLRIRPGIAWNVGYQYYRYAESFLSFQNYRAHTGYTSMVWSF